ncbi:MAG: hypothetical protein SFU98_19285 [Leptospiraceae bacterium]|nr:hypothetical protein [Leptospiraceae bacterium]
MKHGLIGCSFVGVWEKPLQAIPEFDRRFSLNLFGDPYSTTCGFTPEGYVIAKQFAPSPQPSVIISPARIQVSELTITRVTEVYSQVFQELKQQFPHDMMFPFSSIGINSEHEWLELESTSETILNKRFFANLLYSQSDTERILPFDVRFEWRFKDQTKLNVLLQPRAGIPNGVFAGINDDRFWSEKPLPNSELILDLFTESVANVKTKVAGLLN